MGEDLQADSLDLLAADRPDLAELSAEQIAPLERLFAPEWTDTWRDLARSHFITLLSLRGQEQPPEQLARLAVALTIGLAQDVGGQPLYIPVGAWIAHTAKAARVVASLRKGLPYAAVAHEEGVTERRVRQIEAAWRAAELERRQGKLDL